MIAVLNLITVTEPIIVALMQYVRPDVAIRCHTVIDNVASVCEYLPTV